MTLHLIKLSVGPESLADLERWQQQRWAEMTRQKQKPELMHITRHMPKRAAEILQGGSIYWVIKGWLCARQKMLELRPLVRNGVPYCGLIYDRELVRVSPRPNRPFQGWRYLEKKDAPPDLKKGEEIPEELHRELTVLGLL